METTLTRLTKLRSFWKEFSCRSSDSSNVFDPTEIISLKILKLQPEDVTEFQKMTNLTSLVLSDSLGTPAALEQVKFCTSLTSISVPVSVTKDWIRSFPKLKFLSQQSTEISEKLQKYEISNTIPKRLPKIKK
jgi:hypothetical protein